MKISYYKIFAFALMILWACQPDDDFPALDSPTSLKTELLQGTWTAQKVVQVDQEALDNGFPEEVVKQDLTSLFPFNEYKITFNLNDEGKPSTYEVSEGNAPNFLKLSNGMWELDHPVFATSISMSNPSSTNTSSFRISRLDKNMIRLSILRKDATDGTVYSYYEYDFVKSN